ncbi:MAG: type II secretion system GspH family protein [Ruminococcus sp.]|nr:type II secretion system GspH family protein [Ruminococcus sp.]
MRRLKAFTLIELIVVIAIFGIIMTGVVQMISPISSAATSAKVLNNQQTVENAMASYIGENLRYANNLLIVEKGCKIGSASVNGPEGAIDALFEYNPVNAMGRVFAKTEDNKKLVKVIAFEGETEYQYMNTSVKGKGRLISSLDGRTGDLDFSQLASDGSKPQYMVFGNDYYGPANYYINVSLDKTSHVMDLRLTSTYHYSNSASSQVSDSDNNSKNGKTTYELRNYGIGGYVFKCVRKGAAATGIQSTRTAGTTIYFAYIDEKGESKMTIDESLSAGANPTLVGCSDDTETSNGASTSDTTKTPASTTATTTQPTQPQQPSNPSGGNQGGGNDDKKDDNNQPAQTDPPAQTTTQPTQTTPAPSAPTGNYTQQGNRSDIKVDPGIAQLASNQSNAYGQGEVYIVNGQEIVIFTDKPGQYKVQNVSDNWKTLSDYASADVVNAILKDYGIQVG